MSRLPVISGKEVMGRLKKKGFVFARQTGSHFILRRTTAPEITVSIPNHRELKRKTLKNILRQTGITLDEFTKKFK